MNASVGLAGCPISDVSNPVVLARFHQREYLRVMPSVTLKAHYDGERIQLDEPFDLPRNALLLVTVLSPGGDADRVAWLAASSAALARAFGDNEPEYTQADIRR